MNNFYKEFEDHHRGSRSLIKSRLEVYLPFIEPLKTLYENPEILDLGCGRGEWLELTQDYGFKAKGVDLDEAMLLVCKELNLDTYKFDAVDYLRGVEAESISVVSAIHVVEHITFDEVRDIINEAYRILKPGGLLILETPNSENLMVGTSKFYLDPSHQKPLPAQLLSFVVEYSGFYRVKTLYLQDSMGNSKDQQTTLTNVLGGVSPDYSIVAQKKSTKTICELFDKPFGLSYGLRLDILAERYDKQIQSNFQWLQSELEVTKQRIEDINKCCERLEAEAHSHWFQNEFNAATVKIKLLEQTFKSFYVSRSWGITKLLHLLSLATKKIIYCLLHFLILIWFAIKSPFKLILVFLIRNIFKRPGLKAKALAVLIKCPRPHAHLKQFAIVHSIVQNVGITIPVSEPNCLDRKVAHALTKAVEEPHLSSRARRIYEDIKAEVEQL